MAHFWASTAFDFDADPDLAFRFYANPNPGPASQNNVDPDPQCPALNYSTYRQVELLVTVYYANV